MEINRVAIIGAGGEMGAWFANFFAKEGVKVFAADREKKKMLRLKKISGIKLVENNGEAVKSSDLILVSVLLKDFGEVIKEIATYIEENQIVFDILSIKEKPVQIMHRFLKKNLVLGTHPLFGPATKMSAEKQNFFITPTDRKEKILANNFGNWLKGKGFNIIKTSPKAHDRLMAVILGLPHFVGLAAGSALANFNVRKLKESAGPSFRKLIELVQSVAFSSPEFYSGLHFTLPRINELERVFEKEVKAWRKIIKSKNQEKFIGKMQKIKNAIKSS